MSTNKAFIFYKSSSQAWIIIYLEFSFSFCTHKIKFDPLKSSQFIQNLIQILLCSGIKMLQLIMDLLFSNWTLWLITVMYIISTNSPKYEKKYLAYWKKGKLYRKKQVLSFHMFYNLEFSFIFWKPIRLIQKPHGQQ